MNFDGSKRLEGAGAGVVLISPEGDKLKYILRMTFPNASNNEAEYEALIHGMKMAKACGATRLKIFGDSQLVAQQVMNQCDAVNDSMMAYKEVYNELEKLFDGCEVNHISRLSNDEADVLANIESQCLAVPPGVFWEEIAERSTKSTKSKKKEKKPSGATKEKQEEEEEDQDLVMVIQYVIKSNSVFLRSSTKKIGIMAIGKKVGIHPKQVLNHFFGYGRNLRVNPVNTNSPTFYLLVNLLDNLGKVKLRVADLEHDKSKSGASH
ncbi:hypothetical protein QYE76_004859 [Lolium multiflorum]|uniref:RNase H type-1 domain-containing protein n=1 Tax=Lolium multiflorum TaxID=4521 RepID=A0AAD8W1S5_LOLMU|nr:hypothetical protein QYE76_004859 [Lolium multiflorum]